MKVVGITGLAGAGKSTVCRILARRPEIAHIDCDQLAWETYRPQGPAYSAVVASFGEEILALDKTIDRAKLGKLVFSDPNAKATLEALVHPHVMESVKRAIEAERRKGKKLALVEGALLLSSPYVDRTVFDLFVWLAVPEEERRARLRAAGLTEELIARRLLAQANLVPPRLPRVLIVDGQGPPVAVARRVLTAIEDYFNATASS